MGAAHVTLGRQLALAISALFLIALVGVAYLGGLA